MFPANAGLGGPPRPGVGPASQARLTARDPEDDGGDFAMVGGAFPWPLSITFERHIEKWALAEFTPAEMAN